MLSVKYGVTRVSGSSPIEKKGGVSLTATSVDFVSFFLVRGIVRRGALFVFSRGQFWLVW